MASGFLCLNTYVSEALLVFGRITSSRPGQQPPLSPWHHLLLGRSCITNMPCRTDILKQAFHEGMVPRILFTDSKRLKPVGHTPLLHKPWSWYFWFVSNFYFHLSYKSIIYRWIRSLALRSFSIPKRSSPRSSAWTFVSFLRKQLSCNIPQNIIMHPNDVAIWDTQLAVVHSETNEAKLWSVDWSLLINDEKFVSISFDSTLENSFGLWETNRSIMFGSIKPSVSGSVGSNLPHTTNKQPANLHSVFLPWKNSTEHSWL